MIINKEYEVSYCFSDSFNTGVNSENAILNMSVKGEINPATGFIIDYKDLGAIVKPILDQYIDHKFLVTDRLFNLLTDLGYVASGTILESSLVNFGNFHNVQEFKDEFLAPTIETAVKTTHPNVESIVIFKETDPFLRSRIKELNMGIVNSFVDYNIYPNIEKYLDKLDDNLELDTLCRVQLAHRVRTQAAGGTCLRMHGHKYLFLVKDIVDAKKVMNEFHGHMMIDSQDSIWDEFPFTNLSKVVILDSERQNMGVITTTPQTFQNDIMDVIFNNTEISNDAILQFLDSEDMRVFWDIKVVKYIPSIENITTNIKNKYGIEELVGLETPSSSCYIYPEEE